MTKSKTKIQIKSARPKKPTQHERTDPVLRFTPYAWAKLQFLCHHGDTEIGAFGLTPADDLLLVENLVTVKQANTSISVVFDDEAVAEFFEAQVDAGRRPSQFARIWCHTHPGSSPEPSLTDEETLARVFGGCDWAVMFILARGGKTYARLRFGVGPTGEMLIPVEIDYAISFAASDHEAWKQEYEASIHPVPEASEESELLAELLSEDGWPEEFAPSLVDELLGEFDAIDFEEEEVIL